VLWMAELVCKLLPYETAVKAQAYRRFQLWYFMKLLPGANPLQCFSLDVFALVMVFMPLNVKPEAISEATFCSASDTVIYSCT